MSRLEEIAERDSWRCWLCDEAVDPAMSVNDARGPSIDSRITAAKAKTASKGAKGNVVSDGQERLAHRACNTRKGAVEAVVAWPGRLFVVDPAPIIGSVERLQRKGGREVVARCPTRSDADEAAQWLVDRLSRLCPGVPFTTEVEAGGGQFVLVLRG